MEALALAPGVWQVIGKDLRMPGGVYLPSRCTIVRLPDDTLAIYSPIELDDSAATEIEQLGQVAHVIAPNRFHHMFLAAAAKRWPRATVHAAPGLDEKLPGVKIDRVLATDAEPAWRDVIATELIRGAAKASEVVLFHRPTGTLICADLLFHVTEPANLRTRAVLAMMGTGGKRLAQSRLWNRLRDDKPAARTSVERILQWPIQRVALCHGAPVAIDAAALAPHMFRLYGGEVPPHEARPS